MSSVPVPKGVPLPGLAAEQRPQVADGVRALLAPAHARALQTLAHHRFASRFDGARADLPTSGPIRWVIHAMRVVGEIAQRAPVALPRRRRLAAPIQPAQLGPQRRAPLAFDPLAPA